MPVYNTATYLPKCLNSILAVDVSKEIIVINDGSTDNSLNILLHYAEQHPEIRLFHQDNKGVSAARNIGIKNAKGKYIQFVDSDDFLPFNVYSLLTKTMNQHHFNILIGKAIIQGKNDKIYYLYTALKMDTSKEQGKIASAENYFEALLSQSDSLLACWYCLFRTDYLHQRTILFNETLSVSEDNVFLLDVFLAEPTQTVLEIQLPIYFYHYRKDSAVRNVKDTKMFNELFKTCGVLKARANQTENEKSIYFINKILRRNYGFALYLYDQIEDHQLKQKALAYFPEEIQNSL